ncbi:hypothetical protein KKI24_28330 [bacterium]|nr:hypothetical protein [bacterium]
MEHITRVLQQHQSTFMTGLLLVFLMLTGLPATAQSSAQVETDYEGLISDSDSRLVKAMKTNMYEFVADDEEIDLVNKWIQAGQKNDAFFEDEILPIMQDNCTKCHSKTSTMSKAVPEMPLTSHAEILKFTVSAPTDTQCLECHGDDALTGETHAALTAIHVDPSVKTASVHKDLTCVKCHSDFHPATEPACQDTGRFKSLLAADPVADFGCRELKPVNCLNCHQKEAELFQQSTHFTVAPDAKSKAPVCKDCHGTHAIEQPKLIASRLAMVDNCGSCHQEQLASYYNSYHGKTTKLGSEKTAKCIDCHGSHNLLSPENPASTLHADNIQQTCSQCHENVNANFAGFMPHADHTSPERYPVLFYAFWAMTGLLIGTFALFGIHTLLWLYRSLADVVNAPETTEKRVILDAAAERHVRRFRVSHTILHLMIIVSFLSLALSGMTLKFPENAFFAEVVRFFGGPHNMGRIHRFGAAITFLYAAIHLFQLGMLFVKRKITLKGLFKEEYSLIPVLRDMKELKANLLYFIGRGPKPTFGKWTYWEKFDYMAVFWGITIIGSTGLILWFPTTVTRFLPGWMINVATIIHSDEALLAAGFIFTFHFFHSHLRPENFPLDPAIFTQRIPLSRFKEERSREYEELVRKGELETVLVDPPARWYSKMVLVFGIFFLIIGLVIVASMLVSLLSAI